MTSAVEDSSNTLRISAVSKDQNLSKQDKQADAFSSQGMFDVAARVRRCRPYMRCGLVLVCPHCSKAHAQKEKTILERIYDQNTFDEQDIALQNDLRPVVESLEEGLNDVGRKLWAGHGRKGDQYWGKTTERKNEVIRFLRGLKKSSWAFAAVGHVGVARRIRGAFEKLIKALVRGPARYSQYQRQSYMEMISSIKRHVSSPLDTGWQLIELKIKDDAAASEPLKLVKKGISKLAKALEGPTSGIVCYCDMKPGKGFDHVHAWYRGPRLTQEDLLEIWQQATGEEKVSVWIIDKSAEDGVGNYAHYSMDSHRKRYPFSEEERVKAHLVKGRKHLVNWYGCLKEEKTRVLAEQKGLAGAVQGLCHGDSWRIAS